MNQHPITANFFEKRFLKPGFLTPFVQSFCNELKLKGFTTLSIVSYANAAAHFGTWLEKNQIRLSQINLEVVDQFAKHKCRCPGSRNTSSISVKYARRVRRFTEYLITHSIIDIELNESVQPPPGLFVDYIEHLKQRNLSEATIAINPVIL